MNRHDLIIALFLAAAYRHSARDPYVIPPLRRAEPAGLLPPPRPARLLPPPGPAEPRAVAEGECPRCGGEVVPGREGARWCRPCDRAFYPGLAAALGA